MWYEESCHVGLPVKNQLSYTVHCYLLLTPSTFVIDLKNGASQEEEEEEEAANDEDEEDNDIAKEERYGK